MRQTYLITGDALTGGHFRVVLTFPTSQGNWVYSTFLGDLVEATDPQTWITGGESTPDDAAAIYVKILEGIKPMPFSAGDIKWSAAPSLPAGSPYLYCDGSLYVGTDYPSLYSAIGTTYNTGGEPAGNFRVPDLRGRLIAGVDGSINITAGWAASLGGTGGEESHTLTVSEEPSHTHTDSGHTHVESVAAPAIGAAVVGVPIPSAVPAVGATGTGFATLNSSGGGTAHNNLQPTMVMYAYIYTEE